MSRVPVALDHGARAEKQQTLEERVVEAVERRAGEAEHRHHRMVIGHPQRPRADAKQDDPDVLDAVIGEEALEVVLREGPEHSEHAEPPRGTGRSIPTTPVPRPAAGAGAAARRFPILIITPEKTADTCDGAAACASGSQKCSGTTPALRPNAKSARVSTAAPCPGRTGAAAASASKVRSCACAPQTANRAKRASVAAWVTIR